MVFLVGLDTALLCFARRQRNQTHCPAQPVRLRALDRRRIAFKMSGVLFGPSAWDPVAISAQIVAVQCLYYLSLGLLYKLIVGARPGRAQRQ